jgi:hypothetical protein
MPLESLGISTIGKISTISIITLQFLLLLLFFNPWEDKGAHN